METEKYEREEGEAARTRRVTLRNVARAFGPLSDQYPPVMTLGEAAKASRLAPSTLKRKISEGQFKNCVKRGKSLLVWRDKFLVELMGGAPCRN